MWNVIIPAVASLVGGALAGEGGKRAAEAEAAASQQVVQLNKDIYRDQRSLAAPGYLTGGAATNALGAIYGIAPQDYMAALNGSGPGGGNSAFGGQYNSGDWGAGQPVAGHSGGGGPNALLGAVVRNGGDNWKTIATSAPSGYDYDAYFASDPGLASEWAKADVRSLFNGNRDAYLYWQSQGMGGKFAPNGMLKPLASTAPATTSGSATGGTSANALADPMKAFEATPYYSMAVKGFRGVDTPEVNAAFAKGGKVLSGAQSIALDERGKNRLGGAFGSYVAGLSDLAGLNSTAATSLNNSSTNYGANAGSAITNAGQAKGNALASGYAGLNQGVSGALGALQNYGKDNWG